MLTRRPENDMVGFYDVIGVGSESLTLTKTMDFSRGTGKGLFKGRTENKRGSTL